MLIDQKLEKYNIKIDDFEGPLDVLCHLIDINKFSIENINISVICDQYLDYLNQMESLNLEIASEFIIMASNLIYLKSKKLLPKVEQEETITQEELIRRIIEYKRYKEISQILKKDYEIYSKRISKVAENIVPEKKDINQELTKEDIVLSYKNVIEKCENKKNKNYQNLDKIAMTEKYTVESKVKEMYRALYKTNSFIFNNIYTKQNDKEEVVTAFSGLLELSRRQKVLTKQDNLFGNILVEKNKRKNLD